MFSPMVPIISLRWSATLILPPPEIWPWPACRDRPWLERAVGDAARHLLELSLRATKSVSELTSTKAASLAIGGEPDQTFGRHTPGLLGSLGQALGAQPIDRGLHITWVSLSAALQSIMPAPVFSRRSFTIVALIAVMPSSTGPEFRLLRS